MPRGRPKKIKDVAPVEETLQEAPRPTAAEGRAVGRKKRVPINGYRNILAVEGQEPGYHYCWVTDDNVPRYENADYELVSHDVVVGDRKVNSASMIGGHVSIPGGNGVTLHLMRVLEEFKMEDDAALQADIDEKERSMKQTLNNKDDGKYGGVQISVRNRVNSR